MRILSWSCCLGLLATVACIDDSMVDSLSHSGCPAGQVQCGASCVPVGTCTGTGGRSGAGGTVGTAGTAGSDSAGGGEDTGGSAGSEDCSDTATASGTLAGGNGYATVQIPVVGGGKSYYLQTNWWHRYTSQTVSYDGLSFTVNDPANTSVPATDGRPTGFPSFFIGTYAGNATVGSNLPMQVSAITSVPTIFSTNSSDFDTSNFNAAYDVWLTASGDPLPDTTYTPGPGGAYLMVWLFKPASRQPSGSIIAPTHTVDGVSGTWNVWANTANPRYIAYVSTTPLDTLSFDLNRFIRDSVTNGYGITDSMYLGIVFAGFEIWGGGDGLQVKQFCAKVN
jgi:hypothetical protein